MENKVETQTKPVEYYEKLDKRTSEYKKFKMNFEENPPKGIAGVGDIMVGISTVTAIKKIANKIMMRFFSKDCKCKEHAKIINQNLPLRFKARCFTEAEYNQWKNFVENRTLTISREQVKAICKIHSDVFNRTYQEPCTGCSVKPLLRMIERLDVVYKSYVEL